MFLNPPWSVQPQRSWHHHVQKNCQENPPLRVWTHAIYTIPLVPQDTQTYIRPLCRRLWVQIITQRQHSPPHQLNQKPLQHHRQLGRGKLLYNQLQMELWKMICRHFHGPLCPPHPTKFWSQTPQQTATCISPLDRPCLWQHNFPEKNSNINGRSSRCQSQMMHPIHLRHLPQLLRILSMHQTRPQQNFN